jgi:hypothetical protein
MRAKRASVLLAVLIAGAASLAVALAYPPPSGVTPTTPAHSTVKPRAELRPSHALSKTFQSVAEAVRPSLVSINSVKRVQVSQHLRQHTHSATELPQQYSTELSPDASPEESTAAKLSWKGRGRASS